MEINSVLQKELSNLLILTQRGLLIKLQGSRAQRRPDLGKMVTCPHCHHRRPQYGEKCCSTPTPVEGTTQPTGIGKSLIRRLQSKSKRHGQNVNFHCRQTALEFQENPDRLLAAANLMHVSVPDKQDIPAFAEKYWRWNQEGHNPRRLKRKKKEKI